MSCDAEAKLHEYRNGYGQGKADAVKRVNELLGEVEDALHNSDPRFGIKPDGDVKQKLLHRRETLRWLRVVFKKTLECPK